MNYAISQKFARAAGNTLVKLSIVTLICYIVLAGSHLHAQALQTSSNPRVLQIGGMFNLANSSYGTQTLKGGGFYTNFDFKPHYGIELEFHQVNDSNPVVAIYERTYEIGPRYVRKYGRLEPYAKLMYGRGVFNYPPVFGGPNSVPAANLAYNLVAIGVGADCRLLRSFNIRGEYEYQRWFGFSPYGLTPGIFSVGLAYRFR